MIEIGIKKILTFVKRLIASKIFGKIIVKSSINRIFLYRFTNGKAVSKQSLHVTIRSRSDL